MNETNTPDVPEMLRQIGILMRRHGVENDDLLEALVWKYRKLWTEKAMVLRERDKLREVLFRIELLPDYAPVQSAKNIATKALAKEAGQ